MAWGAAFPPPRTFPAQGHGAAGGTRTPDPIITNDVLYRLSYGGVRARLATPPAPGKDDPGGIRGKES